MNYLMLLNVEIPDASVPQREEVLRQLRLRGWGPLLDGVAVLSKVVIARCSAAALRIAHSSVRMTALNTGVRIVANLRCLEERTFSNSRGFPAAASVLQPQPRVEVVASVHAPCTPTPPTW